MHSIVDIITRKRDGGRLEEAEIRWVIDRYSRGDLPEEQMAALAMAIFFRGLDDAETGALVDAMLRSGSVLDLAALGPGRVDKHSTGGVGDKISLPLAPAAAACGCVVPMVSGRGLGHTGGTIDKLEAIGGFSADVDTARLVEILGDVGCAIVGQTADIAPADKRLYALRDVTATVPSLPLIVASIMSKKLAEGIEGLVLDVKVGRGAFMKTLAEGRALARAMVGVGEAMGVRVIAYLTRMDAPIGRMVGNACEVDEALEVLRGGGPEDTRELVVTLGGAMVEIAAGVTRAEGERRVAAALDDGSALARFERMVAAQGGDLTRVGRAAEGASTLVLAERSGFVAAIDALEVALTCVAMGAGRERQGDVIDPAVGVRIEARVGERVEAGEALARVYHGERGAPSADAIARLRAAFTLGDAAPDAVPIVIERLG
ncbi:MAG: thymidine phosphorylase [Deltaproteobacteria bacterium]|nr:thymidine phosphorylase [Deltaproteobacteria bacterium]